MIPENQQNCRDTDENLIHSLPDQFKNAGFAADIASIVQRLHAKSSEEAPLLRHSQPQKPATTIDDNASMLIAMMQTTGRSDHQLHQNIRRMIERDAPHLIDQFTTKFSCCAADSTIHLQAKNTFTRPGHIAAAQWQTVEIVQPKPKPKPRPRPTKMVKIDPELGRLMVALNEAPAGRIWLVAHDIAKRLYRGRGRITRRELRQHLSDYSIDYTRRRLNQILRDNDHGLWELCGDYIYLYGVQGVSRVFAQRAWDENPAMIRANKPGKSHVYVDVSGTLESFEAQLYAGWMTSREDPTIARDTLEMLFGRTADTLRHWEQIRLKKQLKVDANYAQTVDPELCRSFTIVGSTSDGKPLYVTRMPNTYRSKLKQHPKHGQARKVRSQVNTITPPEECAGSSSDDGSKSARVPKQYFASEKLATQYMKKDDAFTETTRSTDSVLIWRGRGKHGHGIWEELQRGICETFVHTRASFANEKTFVLGF